MEKMFFRKGAGAHAGIRCDAHVHTAFSTDSDASVKDMLEAALKKGMDAVCITDHLDLDFPYYEDLGDGAFTFDVEEYVRTLDGLRKEYAGRLAIEKGREKEFELYNTVADAAGKLIAEKRKLNKPITPNVDFYSGFVYSMLNLPQSLYTPLFAIARIAGWSAHRIEELTNGGKIIRPAYQCVQPPRDYVPLTERK